MYTKTSLKVASGVKTVGVSLTNNNSVAVDISGPVTNVEQTMSATAGTQSNVALFSVTNTGVYVFEFGLNGATAATPADCDVASTTGVKLCLSAGDTVTFLANNESSSNGITQIKFKCNLNLVASARATCTFLSA